MSLLAHEQEFLQVTAMGMGLLLVVDGSVQLYTVMRDSLTCFSLPLPGYLLLILLGPPAYLSFLQQVPTEHWPHVIVFWSVMVRLIVPVFT